MARLTLSIPANLPFTTRIGVRVTDLNYGAHLGNDAMVSLIHEARWRFLRAHGMTEADCDGKSLVLGDLAVVYRAECFAGDELDFAVGITDLARVGCDLVYRAIRVADARCVVEAKTGLVFLDPATRKPAAVPGRIVNLGQ